LDWGLRRRSQVLRPRLMQCKPPWIPLRQSWHPDANSWQTQRRLHVRSGNIANTQSLSQPMNHTASKQDKDVINEKIASSPSLSKPICNLHHHTNSSISAPLHVASSDYHFHPQQWSPEVVRHHKTWNPQWWHCYILRRCNEAQEQ
jgi:hypothetical protein